MENEENSASEDTGVGTQEEDKIPQETEDVEKSTEVPEQEEDVVKIRNDFKALKGKVSSLEKERNRYKGEVAQLDEYRRRATVADNVLETYRKSPRGRKAYDEFKAAYKESNGVDLPTYEVAFGLPQVQPEQTQQPVYEEGKQQQSAPTFNPEIARQIARDEYNYRKSMDSGVQKLIRTYPELSPDKLKEMDEYQRKDFMAIIDKIDRRAHGLMTSDPEISMDDAFTTAYETIKSSKVKDQAREEGKLVGRHEAMAYGAGAASGMSGGSSKSTTEETTDDIDEVIMKQMGIKGDKARKIYLEHKKKG